MDILEILGRIGFDWQVALANLVNFLIIFWVLKRFVFTPMSETIEKRKKIITSGLEEKKKAEEELQNAMLKREEIVNEAKKESRAILESAKEEESKIMSEAVEKAKIEANDIVAKAQKEAERIKEDAMSEVRSRAAGLVALGVRKIIEEDISEERSQKFVDSIISDK